MQSGDIADASTPESKNCVTVSKSEEKETKDIEKEEETKGADLYAAEIIYSRFSTPNMFPRNFVSYEYGYLSATYMVFRAISLQYLSSSRGTALIACPPVQNWSVS